MSDEMDGVRSFLTVWVFTKMTMVTEVITHDDLVTLPHQDLNGYCIIRIPDHW